ncbi:MAG: MFS transporter [Candidatus Poseidoniia archaeon]|nr:MFS transporter [Candidatus Poseidoniia archaeon]
MKRLDWYLAVNHGYTHAVLLGIPILILGLVATDGWTRAELVGWFALGGMAYGFGAFPAGWLAAQRPGETMTGGLALAAAGLALAAASPAQTGPALVICGTGLAAYHPAGMAVLAETYPDGTGRALARNGVGGNIGQVAGPLLAATWPWVGPQGVLGLFAAGAVATLLLGLGTVPAPAVSTVRGRSALLVLLTLPVIALQSASTLNGFAFRSVMVITPLEVEDFLAALGVAPQGAAPTVALLITVATVAGIPGTLAAGRAIERYGAGVVIFVAALGVLAGATLLAGSLTGALPGGLWLAAAGMAVFGAFTYGSQPALNTRLAELTDTEGRAVLYGFTFALRFGLSFGAPLLVLALVQWEAPQVIAGLCALAVLPSAWAWKQS